MEKIINVNKIECDEYINNMIICFNEYKSFKRDNMDECLKYICKYDTILDCKVDFLKYLK